MVDTWVELVDGPIDSAKVRSFVSGDPSLGGIVTFEGVTRSETDPTHGKLQCLAYEAHPSMARRKMQALAEEALSRFGVGRVAIVHRVGRVSPGETSVAIAAACGHRAEAFEACRWIIDTLKKDVPIWKKDVFEDAHERWVTPTNTESGMRNAETTND